MDYLSSPDQSIDCFNKYDYSDVAVGYWIYIGTSIGITILLTAMWVLKKEYFPLKERSPFLVITSLIGNMFVQLSFPATFLYEKGASSPNSGVLNTLWSFFMFGGMLQFLPYVFRALRLQYAFNWEANKKILERIYSREWLMCSIILLIALIYSIIFQISFGESSIIFYDKMNGNLKHFILFTVMYMLEMIFLMVTSYGLRFVKSEFNFKKEIISVIAIVFISFNVNVIYYNQTQGCNIIAFSSAMIIVDLRNWFVVLITGVYPLFIASKSHCFLSQKMVAILFQNVLSDETCIDAFYNFILNGKKKEGSLLSASAYEPGKENFQSFNHSLIDDEIKLFLVFLKLRREILDHENTDSESDPKIIESMMSEFVEDKSVSDLFPPQYIFDLQADYRQYKENRSNMSVRNFRRLEGFCIFYFQDVFDRRFKKTRSFHYIKDLFRKNETINKKLQALNMFVAIN